MSVLIVYVDDIIVIGNHTEEMILIKEMLAKEFEVKDLGALSNPSKTPIKLGDKRKMFEGSLVDRGRYQQLVRKLIYLSHTRPNIAFAVSLIRQYMHDPCQRHLNVVYRILRYLKETPGKGLFIKKTTEMKVKVFTDVDWVGSVDDRNSTSRYCIIILGDVVTW
ncbi:uncharacterized mitochondrial protein AtMg00240-like [Humulus lupulus]|uniref:uncharacterized mitochondrial protein AtMg00240-like n=1 Tax=Humulus lupulus TaxID=3486 RepID=UPI002B409AC2|nr:uncharacterized mitochondrial protein AtMg00240-like [Humulus lupulus]